MGGGNPGGGAATGGGKKAGLTCGAGCNAQSGRGGGIRWSKLGGGPRRGYDITSKTNTFNWYNTTFNDQWHDIGCMCARACDLNVGTSLRSFNEISMTFEDISGFFEIIRNRQCTIKKIFLPFHSRKILLRLDSLFPIFMDLSDDFMVLKQAFSMYKSEMICSWNHLWLSSDLQGWLEFWLEVFKWKNCWGNLEIC